MWLSWQIKYMEETQRQSVESIVSENIMMMFVFLCLESETEITSILCTYVGPLQDKEQKCSTQNSTQTLLIKVIFLKK